MAEKTPDLSVETKWLDRDRGILVLALKGFVDSSTALHLDKALTTALSDGGKLAIVDLKDTEYVSSIGWGMFVVHNRAFSEKGGGVHLAAMRSELDFVYRSMGFASLVKSFSTHEAAIAAAQA